MLLTPWFVVLAVRRSRATPQALGARLGYAAAGVVLAFALASPTYVRNWVYLDNPVWPQLIRVFNDPSASPHAMGVAYTEQFSGSHSVGAVVGALQRQARSSVVPAALWVAALGGLLLARSRALAPGWGLLTFAVAWWVLQPRMFPRFATYVVPILVIYTAILAPCLGRRWPRMATLTRVGVGVLLVGEVLAASVYSGGLLSYHWHRDLSVYHRATYFYEQYQWINAHLPDDAKVAVIARSQTFRLDRDYVRAEPAYSGLIDWRRVRDPADLASRLGRLGVTHVFFEPRRHRFFLGGSTVDEVVPGLVEEGLADVVRHWQGVRLYSFRTLGVYQETEVWLMALRAGP